MTYESSSSYSYRHNNIETKCTHKKSNLTEGWQQLEGWEGGAWNGFYGILLNIAYILYNITYNNIT